jgi:hypothetical protein
MKRYPMGIPVRRARKNLLVKKVRSLLMIG